MTLVYHLYRCHFVTWSQEQASPIHAAQNQMLPSDMSNILEVSTK